MWVRLGDTLNNVGARRAVAMRFLAVAAALGAIVAGASPAAAQDRTWTTKKATHAAPPRPNNEPFGKIPKGPIQIVISINQQKLHLYSDGAEIAETLVATGVPQHPTPIGIFTVIQKSLLHHSNIYSGAPMPFMQRITWSGIAMHEGVNLGHPASHGCIRMSHDFATRLYVLTRLGARVVIARPELRPQDVADPRLFVHLDPATAPATAATTSPAAKIVKTAQTSNDRQTTDVPGTTKDTIDAAPALNASDTKPAAIEPAVDANSGAADRKAPDATVAANAGAAPRPNETNDTQSAALTPETQPAAPVVPIKPIEILHASKTPISIFVSRRTKKIYVRQDFTPLFEAAVVIERPEERFGTHVFTAIDYLPDHATFHWNVISLPGESPPPPRVPERDRDWQAVRKVNRNVKPVAEPQPPQTPQQALARITIPQDVADQISRLVIPGSSLIISDQGLGDETGEGTDFVVVAR
jgi:hypothetical protein